MRTVKFFLLGLGLLFCSMPASAAVLAQLQVSSGTISFPYEIMSIKLGISIKKLLKLRPRIYPIGPMDAPKQEIDPKALTQVLTEELPGEPSGDVMYGFVDGTLSSIGIAWLEFKEIPLQVKTSLVEGGDRLWGAKRELGAYEYLQDGNSKQYVEYRWSLGSGRTSLGFTALGVSMSKGDSRSIKRARSDVRLSGEAERKVLANFGLMPSGERQKPDK